MLAANGGRADKPSDAHVVFLFDNGKQRIIDTKAKTVGELLERLPLHLISQDVVEPSRDTPIPEDNFRVNIYRARPVTIVDGTKREVIITAQRSPRVAAQSAGIKVYPEDNAAFGQGDIGHNILGEKIVIDRATPVHLNLYGTNLIVRTHSKTVADLLKEKNIVLAKGDSLVPAATTPLTAESVVAIARNGVKITTVEEEIAPPTQIVPDGSLSFGTRVLRQAGTPGKRAVTYEVTTKNGQVVKKVAIQQVVVVEPVPQVVAQGTVVKIYGNRDTWMAQAGISSADYGYVNYIISRESNWNPASINSIGCAGLGQACPGSKLADACTAWQNNPVCQLQYFTGYAGRYGGWAGAYSHWVTYHWW